MPAFATPLPLNMLPLAVRDIVYGAMAVPLLISLLLTTRETELVAPFAGVKMLLLNAMPGKFSISTRGNCRRGPWNVLPLSVSGMPG